MRGTAEIVQFAADGVTADVRIESVDRRNRCNWYALRLAASETGATVRMVGLRRHGGQDELGSLAVAAGSMSSTRFGVTAPRSGSYRAVYLEVCSDRTLLRVDAPRPPARRPLAFAAGALASGFGGGAVVCALLVALVAGSRALPARPAPAVVPHPVPVAAARRSGLVPSPARIVSFAARRDAAAGEETVLTSYLATGERGTVALLDAAGKTVASAPFAHVGTNRLTVPRAYRGAPLTARIAVHRGASRALASVALPAALPLAAPNAVVDPAALVPSAGVTAQPPARGDGIVGLEGRAVAGSPLVLRIAPQTGPVHVELQDADGATISGATIAAGATRALLAVPPAGIARMYLLAVHVVRNGGEETIVRTIVAAAR